MFAQNRAEPPSLRRPLAVYLIVLTALAAGYCAFRGRHAVVPCGTVAGAAALFAFYGFCALAFQKAGGFRFARSLGAKEWSVSLLLILALNVFAWLLAAREKTIYYWDSSTYWQKTIEAGRELFVTPGDLLRQVYGSVNSSDYNLIVPLVLALPTRLFGEAHAAFVMMNLDLFAVPCALIVALTAKRRAGAGAPSFSLLLGVVLLLPALTFPVAAGYLDAFSLLVLALVFCLAVQADLFRFDPGLCVLLAGLFLLAVLGRRYFVYAVIGMVVSCFAAAVVRLVRKRIGPRSFLVFAANFLLAGGICLAVLFMFFRPFLLHAAFGSYTQKYSAYQKGTYFFNLLLFAEYFGFLFTALCAAGAVRCFRKKDAGYPAFLLCNILVSVSLFFRVQSMDAHHYYIAVVPVLLLLLEGLRLFLRGAPSVRRRAVTGVLLAVMGINFVFAYVEPFSRVDCALVTAAQYRPLYRDDLPTVRLLARRLNAMSGQRRNARIYLLSSSKILNYSALQNVEAPRTFRAVPNLYSSEEVDARDGFPYQFLQSGIVVVCDPVQYCLPPRDQRVVGLLADDFLRGEPPARRFRLAETYSLKNGVKAKVYLKTSPFSRSDLRFIQDQFNAAYPAWRLRLTGGG